MIGANNHSTNSRLIAPAAGGSERGGRLPTDDFQVRFRWSVTGWLRTAAMLCSPKNLTVTLKNLALWNRAKRTPAARQTLATLFDEAYYLDAYPDVKESGIHPFWHYLSCGFLEGRNPSESLDSSHYLALYPDVAQARINPAIHYALFGQAEHRSPVPTRTKVIEIRTPGDPKLPDGVPVRRIDNVWPSSQPLVSVIIPCFNYGRYIEEAFRSVLAQTFHNYEVIIVEGGSTDGVTPGVVAGIEAQRHDRVRIFYRRERHLAGDNRNYGVSRARGRYICCLDADDLVKPTYLEMAVFLAEGFGYDIVTSSLESFGESTLKWMLEDPSFPAICHHNQVATTALFRRSAWAEIGGYRDWGLGTGHIPEDWDFWVRMLGHGYRAKSVREPLMCYRVHGSGLTATCETDLDQQREAIRQTNRNLLENPVVAERTTVIEIANRWENVYAAEPDPAPVLLVALPFITVGGAEQLFHTVLKGLTALGFRIVIITTVALPETVKETPDRYDRITPHVYHLPRLLDRCDWEAFVYYLLHRYRVGSILLAGSAFLYGLLATIRSRFPGIRVVDQQFNDTGHIRNNRRYSKFIDRTVVPSQVLADLLIDKYGEVPDRVKVIPHGIDTHGTVWDREDAWQASGLPAHSRDKLLISFFGRMSEEKSPEVFVKIAAALSHRSDLYFSMTGEGPEWQSVQRLAARLKLKDRLYMPGFVDAPRPLMELSDIVVLTSSVDGMPLVVLEAQALGKPVVASAVGSLPEMVLDGKTGFLCAPGDVDAFCRSIETLADSPDLRERFGQNAREFMQGRFSSETMVESYAIALMGQLNHTEAAV